MGLKSRPLSEATDRLRARFDELEAYLKGEPSTPLSRVANSPEMSLEDATERARKYWDALEKKRSSVPPRSK